MWHTGAYELSRGIPQGGCRYLWVFQETVDRRVSGEDLQHRPSGCRVFLTGFEERL